MATCMSRLVLSQISRTATGLLYRRRVWLALLALLLLLFTVRGVEWTAVFTSFQQLHIWQLFVLLAANLLVLGLQYGRWAIILHTQHHPIPFLNICQIGLAGHAVSYFTPGPQMGGEPVQIYLLHTRHAVPLTTATASVTIDKMLMVLTNFCFLLAGIWVVVQSQLFSAAVTTRLTLVGISLLCLPLSFLVAWWRGYLLLSNLTRYVNKFIHLKRLEKWQQAIVLTEEKIITFYRQHTGRFFIALLLSVCGWLTLAAEYWLMASFIGLTMTLTETIFMLTAVRLAILLPFPGGIGSIEASHLLVLELLGLPAASGIALSFLIHGRDLFFALIGLCWNRSLFWR